MSVNALLAALFGAGAGLGLLILARGLLGVSAGAPPSRLAARVMRLREGRVLLRLAGCAAAGVLAAAFTGWLVAGVLAALGAYALPKFLGRDQAHARELARIEAVAVFTELLRDTLAAAAGLEQAILAVAPAAPPAIRAPTTDLAARISSGTRLPAALQAFADQVADPTCDLVVGALVLASQNQARNLTDLLTELAQAARDQAALRLRTAAGRARTRTAVRAVVGVVLSMAIGLLLFSRAYLAPYSSALGQVVLLVVAGIFTGAFAWMARIARGPTPLRFLTRRTPETTR
jgi:Flp pilus assembly protein TadB